MQASIGQTIIQALWLAGRASEIRTGCVGGVCGAVSKFGSAMVQAHGIPALPVAQPGHCAFLWWQEGKWTLSNDVSGLAQSSVHDGTQLPWCTKQACYVLLMEEAQYKFAEYKKSEKLRTVARFINDVDESLKILQQATLTCVENKKNGLTFFY